MVYFEEAKYIRRIMGYSPTQILMNSKNFNWELKEIQETSKNPNTRRAIDLLLQMDMLYEVNFQRVGARDYCELPKEDQVLLKSLESSYSKELAKAKNWCLAKAVAENTITEVEVYEYLVNKYNKVRSEMLQSEPEKGGYNSKASKFEMYSYLMSSYNFKYPVYLFKDEGYVEGSRPIEVFIAGHYILMPKYFLDDVKGLCLEKGESSFTCDLSTKSKYWNSLLQSLKERGVSVQSAEVFYKDKGNFKIKFKTK